MRYLLALAVACLVWPSILSCTADQPSLAMGDDQHSIIIKLVSTTQCESPAVRLLNIDTGDESYIRMHDHQAYVDPLASHVYARHAYYFKAAIVQGDRYEWSFNSSNYVGPYEFRIRDLSKKIGPRFIQIGDMEYSERSSETFKALIGMKWSEYDGLIHAGDYAYDIHNDNCMRGDRYFNALDKVLSVTPCMFILGNHENYDNGKLFNYRFRMPGYTAKWENNFYSQIRGNVFFLYVNYDYYLTFDRNSLPEVISYLNSELEKSKSPDIKWRVVVTHRPIFCGQFGRSDCTVLYYYLKPFDQLYRKHKIDLLISGHEHFYERLKLMDDRFNIVNNYQHITSMHASIISSPHPLQITNGMAGNFELVDPALQVAAFTSSSVAWIQAYADIQFTRDAIVYQIKAARDGVVMDETVIKKDQIVGYDWTVVIIVVGVLIGVALAVVVVLVVVYKSIRAFKKPRIPELNIRDLDKAEAELGFKVQMEPQV